MRNTSGRGAAGRGALALMIGMLGAALAGCGSSRGEWAELGPARQAVPVEPGRSCFYANGPDELPLLDQVLPLGAAANLRLWGYGGSRQDTLVLSIRYDPGGALQWVRVVGETPAELGVAELERLVGSVVPADGQPDWGVRLLLTGDGAPVRVLPAVVCPAVRLSQMSTPVPGSGIAIAEMGHVRGRRIEVQVLLDERGRIMDAEITRSSGSRLLDERALALVRDTAFRPHLHDGFPVAGWTTVRLGTNWR